MLHFPCLNCTKSIIQAGIKTIYYAEDYHNHNYAIKLLNQSGIEYKNSIYTGICSSIFNTGVINDIHSTIILVGILWMNFKVISISLFFLLILLIFIKNLNFQ